MLRLGLTGGIATGKSVVAGILRELGFHVLDADSLAHKLIEPGQPAYYEVAREFGTDIVAPNGHINRAKLGALVFADPVKLARLNAILHPRVEAAAYPGRSSRHARRVDARYGDAVRTSDDARHESVLHRDRGG